MAALSGKQTLATWDNAEAALGPAPQVRPERMQASGFTRFTAPVLFAIGCAAAVPAEGHRRQSAFGWRSSETQGGSFRESQSRFAEQSGDQGGGRVSF
jgi:hypothetical protein